MSDISGDTFGQGSKLSFSFGTRPAERKKYKSILWYAADLGGPALDENVTSDSRDNLLPGLAAVAAFSVPNLLGSEPQFLHVNIRPQSLKDFAPGALAGAVPAVAAGLELRRRAANGETREALRGDFPNFEHLLAEVIAVTPTTVLRRPRRRIWTGFFRCWTLAMPIPVAPQAAPMAWIGCWHAKLP